MSMSWETSSLHIANMNRFVSDESWDVPSAETIEKARGLCDIADKAGLRNCNYTDNIHGNIHWEFTDDYRVFARVFCKANGTVKLMYCPKGRAPVFLDITEFVDRLS